MRKNTNNVTIEPGTNTALTTDTTFTLPQADGSSHELLDNDSAQTLTNKTLNANNNTISNLEHGAEVDDPASGVHGVAGNVVGTTDAQTLSNKTIDGSTNTITNLVHGTQVDNPSSGVHGVTGDVVGTTDTQDLSNKTVTDALTFDQIATPATPPAGETKLYTKSDGEIYRLDDSGVEAQLTSAAAPELNDNTDVTITAPANGEVLKYNNATSQWENSAEDNPVTSVNGETGTVVLDVEGLNDVTATHQAGNVLLSDGTNYESQAVNETKLSGTFSFDSGAQPFGTGASGVAAGSSATVTVRGTNKLIKISLIPTDNVFIGSSTPSVGVSTDFATNAAATGFVKFRRGGVVVAVMKVSAPLSQTSEIMTNILPPGAFVAYDTTFTASSTPGTYTYDMEWELSSLGGRFEGDNLRLLVEVL